MDAKQARDYIISLSDQPAMKALREHEETLEEVACLLDDVVSLQEHLENIPDFESDSSSDEE
jgi:hypothetical protein